MAAKCGQSGDHMSHMYVERVYSKIVDGKRVNREKRGYCNGKDSSPKKKITV